MMCYNFSRTFLYPTTLYSLFHMRIITTNAHIIASFIHLSSYYYQYRRY